MMKDDILLSRSFFEGPLWTERRVFSRAEAWIDMIQSARRNPAPEQVRIGRRIVEVGHGEFVTSLRTLGDRWGWSMKRVRNFLSLLRREEMITLRFVVGRHESIVGLTASDPQGAQFGAQFTNCVSSGCSDEGHSSGHSSGQKAASDPQGAQFGAQFTNCVSSGCSDEGHSSGHSSGQKAASDPQGAQFGAQFTNCVSSGCSDEGHSSGHSSAPACPKNSNTPKVSTILKEKNKEKRKNPLFSREDKKETENKKEKTATETTCAPTPVAPSPEGSERGRGGSASGPTPVAPSPDFEEFRRWLEQNAPRVMQMNCPLSEAEWMKLRDQYGEDYMRRVFLQMHNWKPLLQKNLSANLTFRNWAGRDRPAAVDDGRRLRPKDEAARQALLDRLRNN